MVEYVGKENHIHRTIGKTQAVLRSENRFDLRNEFTVNRSREIVATLGEFNLKPPFI